MKMSFFCIHNSCSLCVCSLNTESKWLLSNVYLAKSPKENVLKWKFWNCYLLQKFIAHPMIFFSNFWGQNWTFDQKNRHQSLQNSRSMLQFLEWGAYSTTKLTTTAICHQHIVKFSDKSHKKTICGVSTSKSSRNLYKLAIQWSLKFAFIYCVEINRQYFPPLL